MTGLGGLNPVPQGQKSTGPVRGTARRREAPSMTLAMVLLQRTVREARRFTAAERPCCFSSAQLLPAGESVECLLERARRLGNARRSSRIALSRRGCGPNLVGHCSPAPSQPRVRGPQPFQSLRLYDRRRRPSVDSACTRSGSLADCGPQPLSVALGRPRLPLEG